MGIRVDLRNLPAVVTTDSGVVTNLRPCATLLRGHDSHALYQGPTLVGPQRVSENWALAPGALSNQLLQSLERKSRCNFNFAGGVEKAAVVRTGDLTIGRLKGRRTTQSTSGRKKVGSRVNAVDVLVIGEVEDIGQQLQLVALLDGKCLLSANIVNNVPGVLLRVRSNSGN